MKVVLHPLVVGMLGDTLDHFADFQQLQGWNKMHVIILRTACLYR